MYFFQRMTFALAACMAVLLCGCGLSSTPPVPLQAPAKATLAGTRNTSYSTTLTASGGVPPYTWSVESGILPPGLVLSPTGVLSGTPNDAGSFSFTARVTDLAHPEEVAKVLVFVTIIDPAFVTTTSLPNANFGVYYNATLTAAGGTPPYTWKITNGSLPAGLILNATSGIISGTVADAAASTFTVQVTDSQNPAATGSMILNISPSSPPPRNSALYIAGGGALHVNGDGSLTPLPSVVVPLAPLAFSPKLPILFAIGQDQNYTTEQTSPDKRYVLSSMLVNPDYSLTPIASVTFPAKPNGGEFFYGSIVVDPTGSNLYVPGYIDDQGTAGIRVYAADGSLNLLSTVAVPNLRSLEFTPDGAWAFAAVGADANSPASILAYSRSSDGTLTQAATYDMSIYTSALYVSPDGKYVAGVDYPPPHGFISYPVTDVDVNVITNGAITHRAGIFSVPLLTVPIWDESSAYLLVPITTAPTQPDWPSRGAAVFNLSAGDLTVFADPTSVGASSLGRIQRVGSFVYISQSCTPAPCVSCSKEPVSCGNSSGVYGFTLTNGQLESLPASQLGWSSLMVVY